MRHRQFSATMTFRKYFSYSFFIGIKKIYISEPWTKPTSSAMKLKLNFNLHKQISKKKALFEAFMYNTL